MNLLAAGYAIVVAFTSVIGFAAFGWDKRRARIGGRRIPERTLHTIALLGGWPGAIAGQRVFRHKTQKLSFRIVLWLIVLVHLILVAGVIYLNI